MSKIAIITDSSCDLNKAYIEENNIKILPLRVIYSDREYLDTINITANQILDTLHQEVPGTSLPDMNYTTNIMQQLVEEGYTDLIYILISSELSGTYNGVRLMSEDFPQINHHFIDSKSVSVGLGMMVRAAVKVLNDGASVEEIINHVSTASKTMSFYVTFDTLEYLKKGGRVGALAGSIGELLNIKPIITVTKEGKLELDAKVRGRKKSLLKLEEIIDTHLAKGKCDICIVHGNALEEANTLMTKLKALDNVENVIIEEIGAAIAVHAGNGALGVLIHQL